MGETKWTKQQCEAINEKDSNLLVAAAAGSGKTAVLVERIIHKIIDEKIDVDKLLIVTFTNAAASEMRERILNSIYKKIEENPLDRHLQKQITLLNKASICTIHSFCLDIIRNYFYEIDIPANFQIGDSTEMEILKQEVLEELFEEKYEKQDEDFLKLVDIYATYRGDENLQELVLKIENQIQSNPFPKQWLEEKTKMFDLGKNNEQDFSKTIWGQIILINLKEQIEENYLILEKVEKNLKKYEGLEKFLIVIKNDIEKIKKIKEIILNEKEDKWDKVQNSLENLTFEKWPIDRKVSIEYKNEAKQIRDTVKKNLNNISQKTLVYTSKQANETINDMHNVLEKLTKLIIEFEEKFTKAKLEKNRIDFHDIEHLALKILIKQDEQKNIIPTDVALKIQNKFEEIAIDEYQDSNLIQEYILKSVSRGNNIFMVGDIKQSIYRFRQAMPELFLNKYKNYKKVEESDGKNIDGRKIQLYKNFRSREEILNITNYLFEQIMSEKLGDVNYNEEEYLNIGANYPKIDQKEEMIPELHILDLKSEEQTIWKQDDEIKEQQNEENEELEENEEEIIEKNIEEAKFVANKIKELLKSGFEIYDVKENRKRKLEYKDIAILLRTTSNIGSIYEKELINSGLPVFSDTSSEYLETLEIQTVICLLKIIDNPLQDIPFVATLRSPFGNFTDNELIKIRLVDQNCLYYEAFLKARTSVEEELRIKIEKFLEQIKRWEEAEKEKPLNELIWQIYQESNYYNYVGLLTNGNMRQANLKMLFERAKQYEESSFKGLYNFINFLNRLKLSSKDLSAAKIVGENDNVIRIMSIHKSKGLEFPVVFLCNIAKQFNKQDLNDQIVLHQEIGFGPQYIDTNQKIEFPTLAKEAIKLKLDTELISEEMRVLYVALTRAKEKLIITGVSKDFEKSLKQKQEIIDLYKQDENKKINSNIVKKYMSYLDWFILLIAKEQQNKEEIKNILKLEVHKLNDLKTKKIENEDKKDNVENLTYDSNNSEKTLGKIEDKEIVEESEIEKIKQELEWNYKYSKSCQIPTKTSVSKIKEQKLQKDLLENNILSIEEMQNKKIITNYRKPNFLENEEEKISSSRKGTIMHLCLQRLDSNKEYNEKDLQTLIQNLVDREIILPKEAESISILTLKKYLNSEIWKELKTAKQIHKEEPFYMQIEANQIDETYPKEDKILVQGIIDLYFINEKDELILVDYKTDYAEKGEEQKLIEKYKEQLKLYKQALENSMNKKVDEVIIYSTWLGKIECNIL